MSAKKSQNCRDLYSSRSAFTVTNSRSAFVVSSSASLVANASFPALARTSAADATVCFAFAALNLPSCVRFHTATFCISLLMENVTGPVFGNSGRPFESGPMTYCDLFGAFAETGVGLVSTMPKMPTRVNKLPRSV